MGLGYLRQLRLWALVTLRERAVGALAAAFAMAVLPAPAAAQMIQRGFDSAETIVAIMEPGSIENITEMNFGRIAQSNNPGTVVLTPNPTATCTVTGGLIRTGACRGAMFVVMGRRNWRVRIRELSGGSVTLNGPAGATMQVTDLTFSRSGMHSVNGGNGWNLGRWEIDTPSGIAQFRLGGTLHVAAAQPAGVYTGTIVVQVQFN